MSVSISTLLLDVGGVLLTNGWDRKARPLAAETFQLDLVEINERHAMTFDAYETGKLSLDDYLPRVVFHEERSFSREIFTGFMFEQSRRLPDMFEFVTALKDRHELRVAIVSNEGHELTVHRVRAVPLRELADFFIVSCYVHLRKPDLDLFRLALSVAQADPAEVVNIDDRAIFAEVVTGPGIHGMHHEDVASTRGKLARLNLTVCN